MAAAIVPLAGWAYWALVLHLGPNDFHDYWLAGRLIAQGHSPYDLAALQELARNEGLTFTLGGGYSYPLPFAVAMVPLAMLPFGVAIAIFNTVSLIAFGLTVAAWIGWAHGWAPELWRRRLALALASGLYAPVYGTVAMGQANLILMPLLALGAVLALNGTTPGRRLLGGALLGLAAVVKLVPAALVVPLLLTRRFGVAAGLAIAAAGAVAAATLALPWAATGSGGLASLLDPDPFYSNQSINGFVTRLVWPSELTAPVWEGGFDPRPVMLALTAAFGLATLVVLWLGRREMLTRRGAALGLGLSLVAAIIGAPKDSFWNESLVLVAVGLLLAVETPDLRLGRLGRVDLALLGAWFGSALLWAAIWGISPAPSVPLAPLVTLLWSTSLYGLLALWWLFVRRLRHGSGQTGSGQTGSGQTGSGQTGSGQTGSPVTTS